MTTEEMIAWLDDHDDEYFQGERACIRTKLRAAEELANRIETLPFSSGTWGKYLPSHSWNQLLQAYENYRVAGGAK